MITYNHEKYIAKAIDSVLMQETSFDFEIVIGEDESSDRTRAIVQDYAQKYPEKIQLILNKRENVIYVNGKPTGRWNLFSTLRCAKGQYIALLEGDDYWTSPYKLQEQIDFLESNLDYNICYHNTEVETGETFYDQENDFSFAFLDSLKGKSGATLSMVFRNNESILPLLKKTSMNLPMADWPLECILLLDGEGHFMNRIYGVKRILPTGATMTRLNSKEIFFTSRKEFFQSLLLHADLSEERKNYIEKLLALLEIGQLNYLLNCGRFSIKNLLLLSIYYVKSIKLINFDQEYKYSYKRQFQKTSKIIRTRMKKAIRLSR